MINLWYTNDLFGYTCIAWGFPEIVVQPNRWFIMQHPVEMDDFGVPPWLRKPPYMYDTYRFVICPNLNLTMAHGHAQIIPNCIFPDGNMWFRNRGPVYLQTHLHHLGVFTASCTADHFFWLYWVVEINLLRLWECTKVIWQSHSITNILNTVQTSKLIINQRGYIAATAHFGAQGTSGNQYILCRTVANIDFFCSCRFFLIWWFVEIGGPPNHLFEWDLPLSLWSFNGIL